MTTTIWQDNAEAFTTRPEVAVDQQRRAGIRDALELVLDGHRNSALALLARSVERQLRLAGLGSQRIPLDRLPCDCGRPACWGQAR